MSIMTNTIKNNSLLILALLALSVFAASFYKHEITFDDAFFAEQAYWVNKVGYAKTELFNGILDWSERQYVYHKLLVWQTAAVAKYIGWSPYYFKTLPLIYFFVFLSFVYYYFRKYLEPENNQAFYLFVALIAINIHIVHMVGNNRPEIMIMCVGFLSYLSLRQAEAKDNAIYICLAGMLAGLAALYHLNGLIFIAAGSGLLVFRRHYRHLLLFVIFAGAVVSIYFVEIIANGALHTAYIQLIHDPAVTKGQSSLLGRLVKFILAPTRYVNYLFDFAYTLLFVITLYLGRKHIKQHDELKLLLVYFVLLEVFLSLISPGNKNIYLVMHMPYMLMLVAVLQKQVFTPSSRAKLLFVFGFYAFIQLGSIYYVIQDRNSEIIPQHASIVEKYHIQKTDKVLAPAVFIFNEIASANIRALGIFPMQGTLECPKQCLFDYAQKNHMNFVLLPFDTGPERGVADMQVGDTYSGYRLRGIEFGYYIFGSLDQ